LENVQIEAHELRHVVGDRVVLLGSARWRGPASGIETETPVGLVIAGRDGRVIRPFDYLRHQEALEAVGLEE
jgi:hypothetical protein